MPAIESAPTTRVVDSAPFHLPGGRGLDRQSARRRPPRNQSAGTDARKRGPLRGLWLAYKALYYASTPAWQVLKSGALFILGIFCWSTGNLLLSYEPSWSWTYYLMAYGFLLIPWGPVTHLVLVPHVTPFLRRRLKRPVLRFAARHLSLMNFGIFVVHVVLFGLYPPSHLSFEFDATPDVQTVADIDPSLTCIRPADAVLVSCRVEPAAGIGSVRVESAGKKIMTLEQLPFYFELREDQIRQVVGRKEFEVRVLGPDGDLIRSYTRSTDAIY